MSNHKATNFVIIAVLASLAMMPSFCYGITSGNDMFQHYQFAVSVLNSIGSGEIYPSLSEIMNHGFGDVSLRFYPPLSYYVLVSFYLIVKDWYIASLISFFMVFFVGGTGVYLWTREEFPREQSLLAAAIFIFAPYHLNEIYNNFLFAEFSASAVIPFCFLFVTRVARRGAAADMLGLAISYSLLVLTHLPLAVVCSAALFVYGVFLVKKESAVLTVLKLAGMVAFGLVLSSFYWIRMVTELEWVKHSAERYSSGVWGYRDNFLFAPQNLLNFQIDVSNLWLADLMLLSMLLLTLPTVVFLVRNRSRSSRFIVALLAVLIFAVLMTTPLSKPVWDNLAFLQKVQFPWRWMAIVSAVGPVFVSIGLFNASEALKKSRTVLLPIAIGVTIVLSVVTSAIVIKGAVYNSREAFNSSVNNSAGNLTFEGWWPTWTQPAAFSRVERISAADRSSTVLTWATTKKEFVIQPGESGTVEVAALYYPHWIGIVNGQHTDIFPTDSGLISVTVPRELAHVTLEFEEPQKVRVAFWVSGLAWSAIIFFLLFGFVRGKRRPTFYL